MFQLLNSKNIYYMSLKLTSFFRERFGTLGKGRDETFVTNVSSILESLSISTLHSPLT